MGRNPEVIAADEFGFFAAFLFLGAVADAVFLHELVMHDVQCRLGGEVTL